MKFNIASTQIGRLSMSEEHETMCHALFQTTSKLSRVYFFSWDRALQIFVLLLIPLRFKLLE